MFCSGRAILCNRYKQILAASFIELAAATKEKPARFLSSAYVIYRKIAFMYRELCTYTSYINIENYTTPTYNIEIQWGSCGIAKSIWFCKRLLSILGIYFSYSYIMRSLSSNKNIHLAIYYYVYILVALK